ncbi:monofunctional biosynthetic peptidoglycan transglycosylase [Bartonella clarridgeiae]|nr:monofunctional biosynthetic peptidoglycan transglycosylase [Bartonella clarridgeiae]WCR55833.1 MAG: Monofunctional biosynthetic peptidoglycan transglycosylase [Bartonella clarridgeiae]
MRVMHYVISLFVFLFLCPIVLLLIYRLDFVHPVSILMIRDWVSNKRYERKWVTLSDIAFSVSSGVIMSEDGQFCRHSGVDWAMLIDILKTDSKPFRGGSTINMQMIKNLFLWSNRSYIRKIIEIPYSIIADLILSKKRIIEIYLNIAEWGPGIYGIEAAAFYYFQKSARHLTLQQAAALVASLPNPYWRNPCQPTDNFITLTRLIEKRIRFSRAYTRCIH